MKVVIGDKGNETDIYESKIVKDSQDEPKVDIKKMMKKVKNLILKAT